MKYAKKMKLVEIDDINISSCANNNVHIDDNSYSKPYVMSALDNAMNEILSTPISDGDKWKLYSQTLQRYLNHSKFTSRKIDTDFSYPVNKDISATENAFNFSLGDISPPNQFDMSGVERIRDSIDRISQPNVRNFFEKAREVNSLSATSPSAPMAETQAQLAPRRRKRTNNSNSVRRVQPYRNTVATRKRRAETSLSADIPRIRPCKVTIHRLNWSPTTAN